MQLHADAKSPTPIRRLASPREVNPNTIARVSEDLKGDGYGHARGGKGVFVAPGPPARPAPTLRDAFLKEVVIRGAALGRTVEDSWAS